MRTHLCVVFALALLGCDDLAEIRAEMELSAEEAVLSDTLEVKVYGGVVVGYRAATDDAPGLVQVRAQSLDVRIDVFDRGCAAHATTIELSHVPEGAVTTHRGFLAALSAEAEAARAAIAGVGTLESDPHERDWTPLAGAVPFPVERTRRGDVSILRWTVISDRSQEQARAITGEMPPTLATADGACATFTDLAGALGQAALVLRHRVRVEPPTERYSLAVLGNNAGHPEIFDALLTQIAATPAVQLVVITGDLTANGDSRALARAADQLDAALDVPWFATLGDRDVSGPARDDYLPLMGAATFALDFGAARVMVLDSADHTLTRRAHGQLTDWLANEPLWWAGDAAPPARLVLTHVAPFDPYGGRGAGFKDRLEAARVMASLSRVDRPLLLTSGFAEWREREEAGVRIVHAGGGGAEMSSGEHHWVEVQVAPACAPQGQAGGGLDTPCQTHAECGGGLACLAGRCAECLTVVRHDL